jgi:orotidine-5'-phosphate decarboxylase
MSASRTLAELRKHLTEQPRERLIFALDVPQLAQARTLVELLHPEVGVFKVGLELFTASGPAALQLVHGAGRGSFLDLKLHDIPATVARAVAAAAELGASYLTVHAASGAEALREAVRAVEGSALRLLAVTVLTSSDEQVLSDIGLAGPVPAAVSRLAKLAVDSGVQGLVCSAAECELLRRELGPDVILVTPGVRPAGGATQDQKRVATPSSALAAGADLLVVGRPIRDAAEPKAAARGIVQEIAQAL